MGKVLLVIGRPDELGLYMPQFVPLARASGGEVHLLEVSGAAGTGMFGDELAENAPATGASNDSQSIRAPEDTHTLAVQVNQNLEHFADDLRGAGLRVTADWRPDLELSELPDYARKVEADTVAIIKRPWWVEWLQQRELVPLKRQGLRVVELEPWRGESAVLRDH